jgi:hypothetical protein
MVLGQVVNALGNFLECLERDIEPPRSCVQPAMDLRELVGSFWSVSRCCSVRMPASPSLSTVGGRDVSSRCIAISHHGGLLSMAPSSVEDGGGSSVPVVRRIDSPRSSRRWAWWSSRSQMASARVGSPRLSCQSVIGSWLVRIVERRW